MLSILALLALLPQPPAGAAGQPARPAEGRSLEQTPLPADAIIFICENLRQAIGQMQPGSVILGPQRYQEMVDELNRLRAAQSVKGQERPFSSCRVGGEVKVLPSVPSRAIAELTLDLEFRTETPNQRVTLPLRGLSLSKAELDGETPLWGPATEPLSVIVPTAKAHRLRLEGRAAVGLTGIASKVVLEQFPPAASTSLNLILPADADSPRWSGAGELRLEPLADGRVRLQGDASGPQQHLEIAWRSKTLAEAPIALEATGEQRFSIDARELTADARLRLTVTQGQLREVTVELPGEALDLRAEQGGADGQASAAPELFATENPRIWRLRLKQPLTANTAQASLRLRWRQSLPGKGQAAVPLRQALIVEPRTAWQSGTLLVAVPAEAQLSLNGPAPIRPEPRGPEGTGGEIVWAYRYSHQPLELSLAFATPNVNLSAEQRWQHELNLSGRRAKLNSELEISRAGGSAPRELEIRLPVGWTLDPRIGNNPQVREAKHLPEEGVLRLLLAARGPNPLKLRLELEAPLAANRTLFALPRVLAGKVEGVDSPQELRLMTRPGTLTLMTEGIVPRLEVGTQGLVDEQQRPPELDVDLASQTSWILPTPRAPEEAEARLALTWQPQRPTCQVAGEVLFLERTALWRQTITMQWRGELPGPLEFISGGGPNSRPKVFLRVDGPNGPWQALAWLPVPPDQPNRLQLRLPRGTTSPAELRLEQEITSLEAPRSEKALLQAWAWPSVSSFQPSGVARVVFRSVIPCEFTPTESENWREVPATAASPASPPQMIMEGQNWKEPPRFLVKEGGWRGLAAWVKSLRIDATRNTAPGEWDFHIHAELAHLRATEWSLHLDWPNELVQVLSTAGVEAKRVSGTGILNLSLYFPPEALAVGAKFDVRLRVQGLHPHFAGLAWHFPTPQLRFGQAWVDESEWHLHGLEKSLVLFGPPSAAQPPPGSTSAGGDSSLSFFQRGTSQDLRLLLLPERQAALLSSLLLVALGLAILLLPRAVLLWLVLAGFVLVLLLAALAPDLVASLALLSWPGAAALALLTGVAWLLQNPRPRASTRTVFSRGKLRAESEVQAEPSTRIAAALAKVPNG